MNRGHETPKQMGRLVIGIVFALSLPHFVSSNSVLTQSRQSILIPTEDEVVKLADSFMESLQAVGNVRNVNQELLHPLLVEGLPCPVVPFVEANVCRTLSSEDRRDYALAVNNVIWLTYEYQLSQSVPLWLRPDIVLADPFELFPSEVRPVMGKLVGIAKTTEAFKELYTATKEVEMRMLRKHSQMTESDRLNVAKNAVIITEAFRQNGFGSEGVVPIRGISEGMFRYTKPPFVFVVARDRGILKVISLSFVTD